MKTVVRVLAVIFLILLVVALILAITKSKEQTPTVPATSQSPTAAPSVTTAPPSTTLPQITTTPPTTTVPPETALPPVTTLPPETTVPETKPLHSPLYLEGIPVEDVILYFNEVCLDAEYVESGTPELLQKWIKPITYYVHGTPTDEDLLVLRDLAEQLNSIENFPGMVAVADPADTDLPIYFCTKEEMNNKMSFAAQENLDGAVTFWYNGAQEITNAIICIRTDISQQVRNSVIAEEVYNGLGPIQDTTLREDSIIYQYGSKNLELSEMDILILELLYHPQIRCSMNASECESVIRQLYY